MTAKKAQTLEEFNAQEWVYKLGRDGKRVIRVPAKEEK